MHEAALAHQIIELVKETIREDSSLRERAVKVKKINLSLRRPYTVWPESLEFYFTEMVRNTELQETKLVFHEIESKDQNDQNDQNDQINELSSFFASRESGLTITSIEIDDD